MDMAATNRDIADVRRRRTLSLKHWRRLEEYAIDGDGWAIEHEGYSADECAFCERFLNEDEPSLRCIGCPIWGQTGETLCFRTPYYQAREQLLAQVFDEIGSRVKQFYDQIIAMRLFIEDLEL